MDKDLIAEAVRSLEIQHVFLGSHSVKLAEGFEPIADIHRTSTIMNWGSVNAVFIEMGDAKGTLLQRLLRIDFRTRVQVVPTPESGSLSDENVEEAKKSRIADLSAFFTAIYTVKAGAEIDGNALNEFATHNTPFHVWPYWREFLQSTCARVGLPPIQLRMYKIRNRKGGGLQSAAIKATSSDADLNEKSR